LIWPITVAPYAVHLVVLKGKGAQDIGDSEENAEKVYTALQAAGIEVLYDDRNDSPGVKFNDADLIGLPIRLTVSDRAMKQGGVEYKRRDQKDKRIIPSAEIANAVLAEIDTLKAEIAAKLVEMPWKA
jgi:prolyl-tRNA synthetase